MDKIVNIQNIDPNTLQLQNYSSEDENLISNFTQNVNFNPSEDYLEYFILDLNQNILFSNTSGYPGYTIQDGNIVINPQLDLESQGYDEGQYYTIYNFLKRKLSSSPNSTLYIQDISTDRTELRLNTTKILNEVLVDTTTELALQIANSVGSYLDFYLNFGDNKLVIANNIALDNTNPSDPTVLVKLYEPLPEEFTFNTQCWVVEQIAESQAYQIELITVFSINEELEYISGPNFNLNIQDQINNSTPYQNLATLQSNTSVLGSGSLLYQINSILAEKGIEINIDYSDYSEFVHFSSAKTRLENFYYKLSLIENYTLNSNLSSGSSNIYASSSQIVWDNKINEIITNFDGYEYYLFFNSESKAWPKINSTFPYVNYSVNSSEATAWLNNQLESASFYDDENKDALVNTIPSYLREDSNNDQYMLFTQMIGQHFDNIWVYLKDITNKFNADNRLEYGISKDIVAQAIRDLGINIYQNNFSTDDLYSSLIGLTTSGSNFNNSSVTNILPTPTGLEYINTFITASDPNALEPLDDINKEIYKRLYHNLPYLLKKKGTIDGLRSLITTYGIPDTILRITEYGGKDKTNINDWDYWYNYFSYAFETKQQAQPLIPWLPLLRNFYDSNQVILPDTITLRFKTEGIPNSSEYSQSIFVKKSNSSDTEFDFGVFLYYTGSGYTSGSYSGSIPDPYNQYGNLRFTLKRDGLPQYTSSADIYLPFFDGEWWSIMLKRDKHLAEGDDLQTVTYSLYAKNKIYDGVDGYELGFQGSSSITIDGGNEPSWNTSWNNFSFYSLPFVPFGVYIGGYINGITQNGNTIVPPNTLFSGSFQEFRYYGNPIEESTFDDYVMNPKSIEGNTTQGSGSSKDLVDFRAPLGNMLEETFYSTNPYETYISIHPAITGSCITESFWTSGSDLVGNASLYNTASYADLSNFYLYGADGTEVIIIPDSHSNYDVIYHTPGLIHTIPQTEINYIDTPIVGLLTPNSNKIKDVPSTFYGNVLSSISSLQQNYEASQSYTKDNNYLEVAYSPQNEINDDIAESLGYFDIGKYIGDPQYRFTNNNTYPDLNRLRDEYFCKYINPYNLNDYVRLIKYFDNSLFKLIKDFTPAKTNLASGLVIKPHFLERNRYQIPSVEWEQLEKTGSIDTAFFTGSTGGGVEEFAGENPFIRNYIPDFTQSWSESIVTPLGLVNQIHDTQDEFYNGEFSGSTIQVYEEQVNPFLDIPTTENSYTVTQYIGKQYKRYASGPLLNGYYIFDEIIQEGKFLNENTEPDLGEIYLFNDAIDITTYQSSQTYSVDGYRNKFIKISKFNSNGANNSVALGQATQINILMKNNGVGGTTNISFPIQNITEYSTYYLYEISDPETPLVSQFQVVGVGFLYNINLLLQQSPTIPVNVYNNDNEIRNGDALILGSTPIGGGIILSPLTTKIISPNQGYQFSSNISYDNFGYGNFNTSSFSYIFKKTPNINNIEISIDGTINNTAIGRVLAICKKNINQSIQDAEILSAQILTTSGNQSLIVPTVILSGSSLPIENDEIFLAILNGQIAGNVTNLSITKFFVDYITPSQSNTPDLVAIEPFFEIDFTNNDYNALLGNAFEARKSQYYMDVDYSTSPIVGSSLTPINFTQLIEGIANRAQVQDYYYNLQRHTIPRYDGSKTTAAKFSEYTNGDTGYGKEIVAGNPKPFVGYYTSKGGSTPEVLGKTIVNLDYIIDEDINTQVPALSDFTYNNQIQLFERGTNLYLDPDKNSISQQFAGVNKYKIYRSGEYATPILYTQTGSNPGFINELIFTEPNQPPILNLYQNRLLPLNNSLQNIYSGSSVPMSIGSNNFSTPFIPLLFNGSSFITGVESSSEMESDSGNIINPNNSETINYNYFRMLNGNSFGYTTKARLKFNLRTNENIPQFIFDGKLILKIVGTINNSFIWSDFQTSNLTSIEISNISINGDSTSYEVEIESNQFNPFATYKLLTVACKFEFSTTMGSIDPSSQPYFIIDEGSFEIIQSPSPNQITIQYSNSNQYILGINDQEGTMTTSEVELDGFDNYPPTIPCSVIYLNPSFISTFGKIYPQVEGSGYDPTIYPFEIPFNSLSQLDLSEDYEIRFAANEELSFPIIGSYIGNFDSENIFVLIVARPEGYSLQNNITGDTRQSFLIRRWIPKAGYIYLEAGDPPNGLGKGIIRPEYITKGIQDKIPTIIKDLTDKNLIQ
jgi:hypothetical protein